MDLPLIWGEGEDERIGLEGGKKTEGPMGQDASCVPEGLSGLRAQGSKLKSHGSSGLFPQKNKHANHIFHTISGTS